MLKGGNLWVLIGAMFAFSGVGLGAFGAHGLSKILEPRALQVFHTGTTYQMWHAMALIGLGLWTMVIPLGSSFPLVAGLAFSLGIFVFSGSLYALALTDIKWLGMITPIGGVMFLIGWAVWAWSAWKMLSNG